ncbi:MAG: ribonuclease D [Anaerolineae bacterium]|nr:ribonuclease D [Anaerolineae bacterium]
MTTDSPLHAFPPPTEPPTLVETQGALDRLAARLLQARRVGVDTESNGFYAYFERVCLIQFAVNGDDYVVDPLAISDLSSLGEVFASPRVEKIFHAAEFDVISLKRDYGFRFANLFDTMLAARILGWKRYGLGSILEERFGVRQDKRFQRTDWGRRPLTPAQLEYARLDVHYLPALRDIQYEELVRRGRWERAQEAFARVAEVQGVARSFALDGYLRLRGARDLTPRQLQVLKALYRYRDRQARRLDRAPFRVIPDRTLVALSQALPQDEADLAHIAGLTPRLRRQFGRGILQTVRRALREPLREEQRAPHEPPPDPAVKERYEALREWRRQVARAEGVEPDVVLSNHVLWELATRRPTTRQALAQVPDLTPWSLGEYGEQLLALLRRLT